MQSSCYFSIQHSNNMMQQGHWWLSQRSQTIFIAFFQTFVQPSQSNFNVTLHYWVISFHFCGLFTNTLFCSRFLKQYGAHHAKADSSWILFASAYSANSIGVCLFYFLEVHPSGCHCSFNGDLSSFHSQLSIPLVLALVSDSICCG